MCLTSVESSPALRLTYYLLLGYYSKSLGNSLGIYVEILLLRICSKTSLSFLS